MLKTKKHKKIHNKYDYKLYKLLTYITLLFLFLSHLYSIIYEFNFTTCNETENKNITKLNDNEDFCNLERAKYGNYIRSFAFIIGFYNYSNIKELFDSNSLYFLFFVLIIISKYIKMISNLIESIIAKNRENYNEVNKMIPYLKTILIYIKKLKNKKNQTANNQIDIENLIKDFDNLEKRKIHKNDKQEKVINIEGTFKKASNNVTLLLQTSLKNKLIYFMRVFKRIYEHFIIFAIISSIIIKINIWSIFYMIIIISLLFREKNIKKIYYVFIFLIISTLIQIIILILNINKKAEPNINEDILDLLHNTLSIPFYEKYLGSKYLQNGVLLGVGYNHSQLLLIWNETVLIFLIYIYLYYFCFSIFNRKKVINDEIISDKKNLKSINESSSDDNLLEVKDAIQIQNVKPEIKSNVQNNIIFKLIKNKDFKEDISKMKENDYKRIIQIMKYNFNEDIASYKELHEVLEKQESQRIQKEKFQANKENKDKRILIDSKNKIFNISHYVLYLFLHNIILIVILIISMLSPGLLSAIVICFCLYFLYFCHLINKGKKSYYPFVVKKILRFIIIFDISFQLIVQIFLIYYPEIMTDNHISKYILEIIGFREILNNEYEITNNIIYLLGKNFCFFCMTIQKIIYSSNNFKLFYLSYIIKMKIYSFKINSNINAQIFNNIRIKEMNHSLELKLGMEKSMRQLKKQIKEWSKNLEKYQIKMDDFDYNDEEINQNENIDNNIINNINYEKDEDDEIDSDSSSEINNEEKSHKKNDLLIKTKIWSSDDEVSEKEVKKIIKEWIYGQTFLIKIYSYFNRNSYYLRFSSYLKEGNNMLLNLKKGINKHTPNIIKKIRHQINKLDLSHFSKDDIKKLKKLLKLIDKKNNQEIEEYLSPLNTKNQDDKSNEEKEKEETIKLVQKKKFKQFLLLKNSSLFKKYLTKWHLIKKILFDLIIIISNNFCWICYFFMVLNHMVNASIISLFYPISIFCYSLLENPRPPKLYWRLCYIYTFVVLIIKCFFQKIFLGRFIDFAKENEDESEKPYEKLKTFFEQNPIGIKIYDDYNEYFLNLFLDFLLIISLIINRNILMLKGLWEHNEEYFEDIERAMERVAKYKDGRINKEITEKLKLNNTTIRRNQSVIKRTAVNVKEKNRGYFDRLFPKLRNEKPGRDFYYLYAFSMIILIFYLLIFYTTMVKDKTYGDVNISTKQFSGMSIILVLIHMIILIIDRIIYLGQNRYIINYDYMLYDEQQKRYAKKQSKDFIKENFNLFKNENKQLISLEHLNKLKEKFNVSIFQNETFNTPLLEKYILHILLTILSHLFIFFYVTMWGNYNIYNATYCIKTNYQDECNDFQENRATIFFYIFYLMYLTFSALQIKYGFFDIKRASIFKNVKSIHGLLFEVYKIIPFYYPIKNVIDWTVTSTSFGIFEWFKFENIYDDIFKTYRLKYKLNDTPIGQKIKKWVKILVGGLTSLILVLILIIPLILFSSLNPTSELNNVTSAEIKLYLCFGDNSNQERNILIFENNWAKKIGNMTDDVWVNYGYSKSFYTKTFPREQIQIISFYSDPENSLSEFKLNHIKSSLESLLNKTSSEERSSETIVKCQLKIETDFIRPLPSETRTVKKQSELLICDYNVDKNSTGCLGLEDLYEKMKDNKELDVSFDISGFSPIVRLGAAAKPIEIDYEKQFTTFLKFKTKGNNLFEIYLQEDIEDNGIQYHVLNEKVSSGTFGYSVIGFYSAFILVIGTYVTSFFKYDSSSIIIGEMPHPEVLLKICEGIKISRYLHDFKNEEYYFNFLIEILRTPDLVKTLTTSTLKQFNERKKIPS